MGFCDKNCTDCGLYEENECLIRKILTNLREIREDLDDLMDEEEKTEDEEEGTEEPEAEATEGNVGRDKKEDAESLDAKVDWGD